DCSCARDKIAGPPTPAAPMMIDVMSDRRKYFTVSRPLVLIRLVRPDDAYVMVRKFKVRPRQFHFGHMARRAILRSRPARRRRSLSARFCGMTGHAFRVVVSGVFFERFVGVMACGAAYATVVRITLAVKNPVGLESHVIHSHVFQRGELTGPAMTGG